MIVVHVHVIVATISIVIVGNHTGTVQTVEIKFCD